MGLCIGELGLFVARPGSYGTVLFTSGRFRTAASAFRAASPCGLFSKAARPLATAAHTARLLAPLGRRAVGGPGVRAGIEAVHGNAEPDPSRIQSSVLLTDGPELDFSRLTTFLGAVGRDPPVDQHLGHPEALEWVSLQHTAQQLL